MFLNEILMSASAYSTHTHTLHIFSCTNSCGIKKAPRKKTMVKKRDKQGCTEDLHRKLKIEQHESH